MTTAISPSLETEYISDSDVMTAYAEKRGQKVVRIDWTNGSTDDLDLHNVTLIAADTIEEMLTGKNKKHFKWIQKTPLDASDDEQTDIGVLREMCDKHYKQITVVRTCIIFWSKERVGSTQIVFCNRDDRDEFVRVFITLSSLDNTSS